MSTHRMERDGGRSAARWSDLPYDLLGRVRSSIVSLRDRVRFAAVCKPWRAAAARQPAQAIAPLLLLWSHGRHETEHQLHLCGPEDSWVIHGPSEAGNNTLFVGSHDGGWIAMLDKNSYTITIMNLFSGDEFALSRKQRKISSICVTAPFPHNVRIIFSREPTSSDGCILAAMIEGCLHITLCKVGSHDASWTTCRNLKLVDIAFCNGELYGIRAHSGILIKFAIGIEGDCTAVVAAIQQLAIQRPTWYDITHPYIIYIFEWHGKLSVAVKTQWLPNLCPYFKVFKLVDVDADEAYKHKWAEVTSFGDYALFINSTRSKAVHVPVIAEHGGPMRNHMYYTEYTQSFIRNSPHDAVYSVTSNDGNFIKMYCQKDKSFEDGMERTGYYVTFLNYAMWVHPPDM